MHPPDSHLPFDAPLNEYERQAEVLLQRFIDGNSEVVRFFHERLPRFLDDKVKWLPKRLSEEEIKAADLTIDDARLAIARGYNFRDWDALESWVVSVQDRGSPVFRFESAVEAVVNGDSAKLQSLLREDPGLMNARSTRICDFDPPSHEATLLHYVAANGVEGYRQKSPPNSVEIAKMLLEAGAEPDALANMYGGKCTTMSMLVSSCHPAKAGVQVPLVHTLIDYGASPNASGEGSWTSPLMTALVFGYQDSAQALVERGAIVDTIEPAAGLGRADQVAGLLDSADSESRHRALAIAALLGQVEVVRLLLDAGEDPNRYNPDGMHAHGTSLHHAVWFGHMETVKLLIARGARLDIRDTLWNSTPLGWAEYGGKTEMIEYLSSLNAPK